MKDNRYELAERHGMSKEFIDWFFDKKKNDCGNLWFMTMAVMWEGWKASREQLVVELPEGAQTMNYRDQFEESYSKTYGTPKRVLESLRYNDTYHVTDGDRVDIAWRMWKASREELVIKLIPDINPLMFNNDVVFGYQKAKNEVIEVLKTAGITVKSD
jgi:hypothetical protein